MNYITAERVAKHIENNMDLVSDSFFRIKHFGNMISLVAQDSLFHSDLCILAYVNSAAEKIVINSNVDRWNERTKEFKKIAEKAIELEKPFEKIRTNMVITTLDTYMKGIDKGFNVYLKNNDVCLDYYNRPCSSTNRFATFVNMDPSGCKEGKYMYLTKETNMFESKYCELLNDITSDIAIKKEANSYE